MLHWRSEGTTTAKIVPFESVKREPVHPVSVGGMLDTMGIAMKFSRNAEIFAENEPANYIYKVVSGAVRTCKLTSDGRRQIGAFYLPGDTFGLESDETHDFSAEAIGDCTVRAIKRTALMKEAAFQPRLVNQLWAQTMEHLQRAQHHILLLGRKNAQERIAAFLLDMAARLSRSGDMDLPMPRQDIADYLGLTIETVSRTLTQLERDGLIGIPAARKIIFRNRAALDVMKDSLAA